MKWNDVKCKLPIKDGFYLCIIEDDNIPTILEYDVSVEKFYFEGEDPYEFDAWQIVTYWMDLPEHPKTVYHEATYKFTPALYCISLPFDKAIVHREHLQFILQYYCLPPFLEKSFEELLSKIKNVLGDKE